MQQSASPRVQVIVQETPGNLLFEIREKDRPEAWIHRTYMTKQLLAYSAC